MSPILQSPPTQRSTDKATEQKSLRTLIDELILEQQTLQTPVARFAQTHRLDPDLAGHYKSLIPLSKPGAGEQYAFEVALDRCTGCKACVSACHGMNGLDDDEVWRDTGLLLGGDVAPQWQQTITTACHHCEDPGCMNGCPVGAYQKEEDTGIVRHLDDQCIGCSYCILKCPYDVPKYSRKRGIVRKCDMCHQRLAEGEAPACVQACPTEAIRIVTVKSQGAGVRSGKTGLFSSFIHNPQSSIPASHITLPTTRYTGRALPNSAFAADRDKLAVQHAHWPLVLMLVLTQAGIGTLGGTLTATHTSTLNLTGTVLFCLGMGAAVLHLGQPLKAWRFFLGLKTSWLSREILAFSLLAPIPLALCLLPHIPRLPFAPQLQQLGEWSLPPLGVVAIFTSVMIYHDTHRDLWRLPRTALRFFGTALLFASWAWSMEHPSHVTLFALLLVVKSALELPLLQRHSDTAWSPDAHSARLLLGPLRRTLIFRHTLAAITLLLAFIHPWIALPTLLLAEVSERLLFFRAVQAPKMPGMVNGS